MAKPAKLQNKYLRSLFIVALCVDLLLTLALFVLYTGSQISHAAQYSTAQLEQVCASLDILYDSLGAKVNQIVVDPDTTAFLQSSRIDRLQEARVGLKLRTLRTADPYLRYITIYNEATGRYVSSCTAGDGSAVQADQFYAQLDGSGYACLLRPIGESYNTQPRKDALVYTFIFSILGRDGTTNLVVLDVNDSYFNSTVEPIRVPTQEQQLALVDSRGHMVSTLTAGPGQKSFSVNGSPKEGLTTGLPVSQGNTGSFTYQGRFGTYAWASQSGWTVYHIIPYSTVLEGIPSAMALTLALTMATLLFGYLLSRRVSSQLYAPIKALYESYVSEESQQKKGSELEQLGDAIAQMHARADTLEQGLSASYRESKNLYLRYLLFGEEKRIRGAAATYQRLNIDLAAPGYGVALIKCVPQQAADTQEANLFICYYALENITRELLATSRGMEFLRIEENLFAALVYLDLPELEPRLYQGLETIAATMRKEFRMDATICVGDVALAWENINLTYEQTRIALDSHSAGHYGKVFLSRETPEAINSELYYNTAHKKREELIRAGDLDACAKEFDLSIAAMRSVSFREVKTYCRHVLMSALDNFSSYFEGDDLAFAALMEQLKRIDSCQNVQSLKSVYLAFMDQLCRKLGENRRGGNQAAALSAKDYIDRNYADPDLSMRVLAEKMGLSPSYMGKVFTAVTTYSFNDYLTEVRLTQAAKLLCSTKESVSQVSASVGIPNANYFYSLFKKKFGTTPAAYRKQNRDQD